MSKLIFGKLSEREVQILKLLKLHLRLGSGKLVNYMQETEDVLREAILHLEREGLVTAKYDGLRMERVFSPTARGISQIG